MCRVTRWHVKIDIFITCVAIVPVANRFGVAKFRLFPDSFLFGRHCFIHRYESIRKLWLITRTDNAALFICQSKIRGGAQFCRTFSSVERNVPRGYRLRIETALITIAQLIYLFINNHARCFRDSCFVDILSDAFGIRTDGFDLAQSRRIFRPTSIASWRWLRIPSASNFIPTRNDRARPSIAGRKIFHS